MKTDSVTDIALDKLHLCERRLVPTFTDFYDPAKWTGLFDALKNRAKDVQIIPFGGAEDCERRMVGFFPKGHDSQAYDFPIERLRIKHNTKFNKMPRHQDYLGSILGLGFDRGRIGDIFIPTDADIDYAEAFVHKDIADYITSQLEKVGRVPVTVTIAHTGDEVLQKPEEKEEHINVASLRLDAVAAAVFKMSRGKVSGLISSEKVFVNWSPCTDKGKQIKEGDMLTVRGYGRARVGEVLGSTKKERLRLVVFRTGK